MVENSLNPLVSRQWLIKTEGMGAKALKAVMDGDIEILPIDLTTYGTIG